MNKVYKYSINTKELREELEINRNYGTNLPFTTSIKPLENKNGFTQCFNETSQKWEYVEDNRDKTVYSKTTKGSLEVDYLGTLKAEHTLLVPKQFDKWSEDTQSWIEDEILKNEYLTIQKKAEKVEQLSTLVVITSQGNTFDGNETARLNMVSAIQSAELLGQISSNWKLADNTVKEISLNELKEALALSIQKVGEIVTNE
ncbi:hypothetical protein [Arcobacter aquimarinus]|uniref:DUF4376 domain-containing protein n=1 Tax=Arcobacter aquimarinus TaxID=1315211 RepID=A0AAE7E217_9BACT|nr:hypothetical protein [Arcobacter aquimarinus]QKE26171.1 hypothetical protein AAQM_1424 [Arcobacter aquimarinus]RXI35828.1 hypothetical protein CP986_05455 [Arcobacter aquimarinus]